jgi:hypothetical protein
MDQTTRVHLRRELEEGEMTKNGWSAATAAAISLTDD